MIPKIVYTTCKALTWEEHHLIGRNKKLLRGFNYIVLDDHGQLELLKKYMPQHVDTYLSFPRGVVRADISRCLCLYDTGGIYCDTDYKFYRVPDEHFLSKRCVLGIEIDKRPIGGAYKYGNAFIASEKAFPLWLDFVESIFENHKNGIEDPIYLSGPKALTQFILAHPQYKELIIELPQQMVYPDLKFFNLLTYRDQKTIGAHLFWSGWIYKSPIQKIKNNIRRILSALS